MPPPSLPPSPAWLLPQSALPPRSEDGWALGSLCAASCLHRQILLPRRCHDRHHRTLSTGISGHALTESNRLFTYARPPPLAGPFSPLLLIFIPAFIPSFGALSSWLRFCYGVSPLPPLYLYLLVGFHTHSDIRRINAISISASIAINTTILHRFLLRRPSSPSCSSGPFFQPRRHHQHHRHHPSILSTALPPLPTSFTHSLPSPPSRSIGESKHGHISGNHTPMANILPLRRIKIYLRLEIIIFLGEGSSRHPGNTYGSERGGGRETQCALGARTWKESER